MLKVDPVSIRSSYIWALATRGAPPWLWTPTSRTSWNSRQEGKSWRPGSRERATSGCGTVSRLSANWSGGTRLPASKALFAFSREPPSRIDPHSLTVAFSSTPADSSSPLRNWRGLLMAWRLQSSTRYTGTSPTPRVFRSTRRSSRRWQDGARIVVIIFTRLMMWRIWLITRGYAASGSSLRSILRLMPVPDGNGVSSVEDLKFQMWNKCINKWIYI